MRRFLPFLLLVALASPLAAQKKAPKPDRYRITAAELADYMDESLIDVIRQLRPHFLMLEGGASARMGEATLSGSPAGLVIYVGSQSQGDSTALRFYKARDVKEVRYYRPNEAMTRLGANNAYVIHLTLKDNR